MVLAKQQETAIQPYALHMHEKTTNSFLADLDDRQNILKVFKVKYSVPPSITLLVYSLCSCYNFILFITCFSSVNCWHLLHR